MAKRKTTWRGMPEEREWSFHAENPPIPDGELDALTMRECWETLAAAIAAEAAADYRAARRMLRRQSKRREASAMIQDAEAFFRSRWYTLLTAEADGEEMIRRLKEEDIG